MKRKRWAYFLIFGAFLFCVSGCAKLIDRGQSITAVGSSALQLLVESAGEKFSQVNPGKFVIIQGGGSGTGLSQVQEGAVQIGNSDLFAEGKKGIAAEKLVDHKVCVVGITPVINKNAKVEKMTMEQLRDIFLGKIQNWKEVGGADIPIVLLNRASGSGTRIIFEQCVLSGRISKKAQEQDSSGMVRQTVSSTLGAISYLAFSYAKNKNLVKPLIDGIAPNEENVASGKWKIWSYEHMYTNGEADPLTKEFLEYMDSPEVQMNVVKKLGYISINEMKVKRDAKGFVKLLKK